MILLMIYESLFIILQTLGLVRLSFAFWERTNKEIPKGANNPLDSTNKYLIVYAKIKEQK